MILGEMSLDILHMYWTRPTQKTMGLNTGNVYVWPFLTTLRQFFQMINFFKKKSIILRIACMNAAMLIILQPW